MSVWVATEDDMPQVMELCAPLYDEEGAIFPLNMTKAAQALRRFMTEGIIVVAKTDDGATVGCAATSVETTWWSDQPYIRCWFCFVHPNHRKSTHARDMLRAIKVLGKTTRMRVLADVLSETRTEGKCRLYQREFRELGKAFVYP